MAAPLTLKFLLQDAYSAKINKIMSSSDRAAKSMEKASKAADRVNSSLNKAGSSGQKVATGFDKASSSAQKAKKDIDGVNKGLKNTRSVADKAASALSKLFAVSALAGIGKKLANASDSYINANTRLGLINKDDSGNIINPNLQNQVYASAQRSRADYGTTANAIANIGMNAGSAFKGQNELIGFVEAINKQFVIAGASAASMEGAMTQLTQAMGSGALRGEELNSILDAAPSIARNIEKYMGWAEGSIKKYAEQGLVSAEVVKNAQLAAMDDINEKFNSMPMTWSQLWTTAMNSIQKATAPFLIAVNWIANNMDIIGPLLLGIAAGLGVYAVATYGAAAAQWVMNTAGAAWNAICAMNPVGLVVIGIIALVAALYAGTAAFNKLTGSSISATGIIGAVLMSLVAFIYNNVVWPWLNLFAMVGNFMANFMNDPVAAVKVLVLDMANSVVSYVLNMAKAIEAIINKIPGVHVDITSGLSNFQSGLENRISQIKDESGWQEYIKAPKLMDYVSTAKSGYSKGSSLAGGVSDFFSGGIGAALGNFSNIGNSGLGTSGLGTSGNPAAVKGTGSGGSLNVSLEDEDIEYLRDLAERDYIMRIAQNTLAPNIRVEFTGDIHETTDIDSIGSRITQILRDEIETAPEGLY
ncbi:MAG: tape measure protein [Candidatus Avilachnospira sp.]|jgi:tape measure domain-containing protein